MPIHQDSQSGSLEGFIRENWPTRTDERASDSVHNDHLESGHGLPQEDKQPAPNSPSYVPLKAPAGKKAPRRRFFGLGQGLPTHQPQIHNADDYEYKYPDDQIGEELGTNARFYRVYLDEHAKFRLEIVEGWKDNLDVLLVFAGLFSAVVTTIVVEASQGLQPDYGQITTALLIQQSTILSQMLDLQRGIPLENTPSLPDVDITAFAPSNNARWVNGLWFTSLSLSLATALIAVVAKQWIQNYMSSPTGTPRDRAHLLHMRYLSLKRWRVSGIIGLLPFLLHSSLLLFFCGLVVYLVPTDRAIGIAVGCVALACYIAYFATMLLPLVIPTCAYKTSLSYMLYNALRPLLYLISLFLQKSVLVHAHGYEWGRRVNSYLRTNTWSLHFHKTLAAQERSFLNNQDHALSINRDMFTWMHLFSFSPSTTSITLQAGCSQSLYDPKTVVSWRLWNDLYGELERSSKGHFDNPVKLERLALALVSLSRTYSIDISWYVRVIEKVAYEGIRFRVSTWVDLMGHLPYTFASQLSILCYYPDRFCSYWRDSLSTSDEQHTILSLVLSKGENASARQMVLRALCVAMSSFTTPNTLRGFFQGLCYGEQMVTDSHLRLLAFRALTYAVHRYSLGKLLHYPSASVIDALEEVVHEIGDILPTINNAHAEDGCTTELYIDSLSGMVEILKEIESPEISFSRYAYLENAEKQKIREIRIYAQGKIISQRV